MSRPGECLHNTHDCIGSSEIICNITVLDQYDKNIKDRLMPVLVLVTTCLNFVNYENFPITVFSPHQLAVVPGVQLNYFYDEGREGGVRMKFIKKKTPCLENESPRKIPFRWDTKKIPGHEQHELSLFHSCHMLGCNNPEFKG